ncbi:hypothetical protein [Legionella spiritensis]|uniref:Glutathione synthase/Ribosomal protein S6 modification enzyme (Glutaminyl transferase) n=2 Tax=Legionella spiritensis TaxID=452 RepID=A0A0W0YXS3_LEGSP|nr:hypothetical protein [Legionella spiritensis]KTD61693.1 hypothetical protein Lspi_2323 [Legionella spiritensis]SNV38911.1 Glutathione synthase/Ribosomal protein S6 modification enzyme (glutaminyl transferase) [Legionella spiritensis]
MKFLIPTEPDDSHALLVKMALENMGHYVQCLFTADQPTLLKNSAYVDQTGYRWKSADDYESVLHENYEVVWWRRARKPYIPQHKTHPGDYKFALRENTLFYESLTDNMAPNSWWVNPKGAANKVNSKLYQLNMANECGMDIPITLCSNDPKEIRNFLSKYEEYGVIYKPLCSNFWFEEEQVKISYTSSINFKDLPDNHILQLVPGIFQIEIEKIFELRVTCFGDYIVAAKLHSQIHPDGKIDWRAIPEGEMIIEPYRLPPDLEDKIRVFMHKTGIVFGSFDFIVTPCGRHIFLEVNEQGQFLWIEEYNPDFKMLDMFVRFLLSRTRRFHWNPQKTEHTIARYQYEMNRAICVNMERHIDLNCAKIHSE